MSHWDSDSSGWGRSSTCMSPKAERISRSLTQNQTPDGLLHRLRWTPPPSCGWRPACGEVWGALLSAPWALRGLQRWASHSQAACAPSGPTPDMPKGSCSHVSTAKDHLRWPLEMKHRSLDLTHIWWGGPRDCTTHTLRSPATQLSFRKIYRDPSLTPTPCRIISLQRVAPSWAEIRNWHKYADKRFKTPELALFSSISEKSPFANI